MNLWKPIDAIADWIVHELDARAQMRAGVLLALLSLPVLVAGLWSTEPFMIYEMSALALTLTGIGIVLNCEILEIQEKQEQESNADDS